MNKNTIVGIIVAVAVLGGIVWYARNQSGNPTAPAYQAYNQTPSQTYSNANTKTTGNVVFSVTDAATSMQNISSVTITVSKIEMHSETKGWVTVSDQPKQFDLLQLKSKGQVQIETTANVAADTYKQIRMHVDKVVVVESGKAKEAKLPSGELKVNGKFVVKDNSTTSVKFDFLADKSLHTTGSGEFIFAPVVKVEARSGAKVQVASDGIVVITGGDVDNDEEDGMDVDGSMKVNFMLKTDRDLEINNGVIKLKPGSVIQTTSSVNINL